MACWYLVSQHKHACMQLLGELLLERSNLKVMVRYVADEGNLKLMMNLLRDSSRSIQFEAFHVFKVWYMRCLQAANQNCTRLIAIFQLLCVLVYVSWFASKHNNLVVHPKPVLHPCFAYHPRLPYFACWPA